MGKLLIVLFSPPLQSQNVDTVFEFAKAAIDMGHEVTIFCDVDAVYSLLIKQMLPGKSSPASKLSELIGKGAHVMACRESARIRGVNIKTDALEGVIEGSLGKLAELMEESDRIMALGP